MEILESVYETLAEKIPMSGLEKWESVKKTGMLFNVPTHLRNMVSNAFMMPIRKLDDAIANVIERMMQRLGYMDQGELTRRLGWSTTEHGRKIKSVIDDTIPRAEMEIQSLGKYNTSGNAILRARDTFSSDRLQWFNKLSKLNDKLMTMEDMLFFDRAFRDSLGQIMTARGMSEVTDEVYDLAFRRAGEAVFRGENALSKAVLQLKNGGGKLRHTLVDSVVPFVETPSNIMITSFQHSPMEAGVVLANIVSKKLGKSGIETAEIINKAAKATTGTVLTAAGVFGQHPD